MKTGRELQKKKPSVVSKWERLCSWPVMLFFVLCTTSAVGLGLWRNWSAGKLLSQFDRARAKAPPELLLLLDVPFQRIDVPEVAYKLGGKFIRSLAARQLPLRIVGSPIFSWKAYKWDLLNMARSNPSTQLGFLLLPAGKNVFVLGSERDRGGMLGSMKDFQISIKGTLMKFLTSTFSSNTTFLFRSRVEDFEKIFDVNVGNWNIFQVNENKENIANSEPGATIELSNPATVIQTAVESSHLILCQLQGIKKLQIFPPVGSTYSFDFPNIAFQWSSSQLRVEERLNRTNFGNLENGIEFYETILQPGDSLYIPPFWQVRHESITLSVSLLVDSPSSVKATFTDAMSQKIPLGDFSTSQSLKSLGVLLYLEQIVSRGVENGCFEKNYTDVTEFVKELVSARYLPYFGGPGKSLPQSFDKDCWTSRDSSHVKQLISENAENFALAAEKLTSKICRTKVQSPVKKRVLMDYIEQLTRWAVTPRLAGAWLLTCFA